MKQEELKELAQWLRDDLLPMPKWRLFMRLIGERFDRGVNELIDQVSGPTDWQRGYLSAMRDMMKKPENLIHEMLVDDTTDTSTEE